MAVGWKKITRHENWMLLGPENDRKNITGKVPQLKARLFPDKTNSALVKLLNKSFGEDPRTEKPFTTRTASKIRNRRRAMPSMGV